MCVVLREERVRTPEGTAKLRHVRTRGGLYAMALGEPNERPPVLLIHGYAQNGFFWHTERRSFAVAMANTGRHVVVPHLRGQLDSDVRAPGSFEQHAEDLIALTRELGELDIVGHSMGGMLAHRIALASPQRTRRIVTVGTPYKFGLGSTRLRALSAIASLLALTRTVPSGSELPTTRFGQHLRKRARLYNSRRFPVPVRPWIPKSIEPEVLSEYLRLGFSRSTTGVGRDLITSGPSLKRVHQELRVGRAPLLVIAGTKDQLAPEPSIRWGFERATRPTKRFLAFRHGHADLIVGARARQTVWPAIVDWVKAP